jgi:hypothetical protein
MGIQAGMALAKMIPKRVVYTDRGISFGMGRGIEEARELLQEVEYRELGGPWAILEIASMSVEELLRELEKSRE